jgi:glycosyltransferase involved in cell wall biosynthesis
MYSLKGQLKSQDVFTIELHLPFNRFILFHRMADMMYPPIDYYSIASEEENIIELYNKLYIVLSNLGITYEIRLINDGSTDNTFKKVKSFRDNRIRMVRFQRNYGKAAAFSCGFKKSLKEKVITIDGDLQDDPKEILKFLNKSKELDMVSG